MKTILLTGSAGFLGKHIAPAFGMLGYQVWRVDPNEVTDPMRPNLHIYPQTFAGFNRSFDIVIHLAANIEPVDKRLGGGMRQFINLETDRIMCAYIERHPPKECFVAMSSCSTDAWETDPYAFSKVALERMCSTLAKGGVPVMVLKPFSGYGPGQKRTYPVTAIIERALRKEDPLTVWGSIDTVRDFVYVSDVVDAIVYGLDAFPHDGTPVQIGTGRGTSMWNLAMEVAKAVGYEPMVEADITKPTSTNTRIANTQLAEICGWKARVDLKEGVLRTVAAVREEEVVAAAD